MTVFWHHSITRIKTADGIIVGSGFLIADRLILTCAHVITAALQKLYTTIPPDLIHLDFPFLNDHHYTGIARVIFWLPKQANSGDIAILELISSKPDNITPTRLVKVQEIWGHRFRAFGFPVNHDDGVWISGVLRDKKANGQIQIEEDKASGYAVEPGFSGTPVWDEALEGVVGIIATSDRKTSLKTAFLISSEQLISATKSVFDQSSLIKLKIILSGDLEKTKYRRILEFLYEKLTVKGHEVTIDRGPKPENIQLSEQMSRIRSSDLFVTSNSQFEIRAAMLGGTSSSSRALIINSQRASQSGKA